MKEAKQPNKHGIFGYNYKKLPLHHACMSNNLEDTVSTLMNQYYVNTCDEFGKTPLHLACAFADISIVNYLLESGAAVDACDEQDESPLHIAAHMGRLNCVSELLDFYANPFMKNIYGKTPYDLAVERHFSEVGEYIKKLESEFTYNVVNSITC